MRRRRPEQDATKRDAPKDVVEEEVQTDDETFQHAVRTVMAKTAADRQKGFTRQMMSVQKKIIASRRFLFPLGLVLGIFLTYLFFPPLPPHLSMMLEEYDLSFPLTNLSFAFEWRQLADPFLEGAKTWRTTRDFKVGRELHAKGLGAKYPVVLVPGIVSTGLESWSTSPEYQQYFRKRLWGTTTMIKAVVTEKDKWMAALMLDPETGLDPPGVKVRAAQGLDAASTFIPGYWIWAKVIENLACINYDSNNMELAAYDWRLSYYNLEVRDGYFSRLKSTIESFHKREGKKTVLVGHSMGSTVILYFLKWVEAPGYGDGGNNWVETYVESFINIAGPMLGVPKAMTAFLSGEMKDTVEVNPAGSYVLEKFFSRKDRARLFRSWGGSASMYIKGGDAVWGNNTHAPDDQADASHTHGHFISFRAPTPEWVSSSIPPGHHSGHATATAGPKSHPSMQPLDDEAFARSKASKARDTSPMAEGYGIPIPHKETAPGVGNLTAEEAGTWILEHTPNSFQKMLQTNYSYGLERDEEQLRKNNLDHTKWTNPLEIQLPIAPSLKIFCLYGHGKDTERSYWYARGEYEYDDSYADALQPMCMNTTECDAQGQSPRPPLDLPLSRQNWIDALVTRETDTPRVKNGVKIGEGDGTVPTLSLGGMCVEGWKRHRWNPAGVKVVTYEMAHKPEGMDIRGGATTADHIDILGSSALNEIVLRVAAGQADDVVDHFVSDIEEYARRVDWD